jgi:hypothetical protein
MPFRNAKGRPRRPRMGAVAVYLGLTLKLRGQSRIGTFA